MVKPHYYWTLHVVNRLGQYQCNILPRIKDFFADRFNQENSDRAIQSKLLQLWQENTAEVTSICAHLSLRCFVSGSMYYNCHSKVERFGLANNFSLQDLLPFVLDEPLHCSSILEYIAPMSTRSLTTRILETFDPERSNLSTWTSRLIQGDPELRRFLMDHGVLEVSDWLLLCNRSPNCLDKILPNLSSIEIATFADLLKAFHQIYREQRRTLHIKGKRYIQPTFEQLTLIGDQLKRWQSPEAVLASLQQLAKYIRDYIIQLPDRIPSLSSANKKRSTEPPLSESEVLLNNYLDSQIQPLLASTAKVIILQQHQYLRKKSTETAQHYINGMHRLYCQSQSMGEIGNYMGKSQSTVTRLLKLNSLRADISRTILTQLPESVFPKLPGSPTPKELKRFNSHVEAYLTDMMAINSRQVNTSRNRHLDSPFAQILCQVLCDLIHDGVSDHE